ncbi:MAG: D-glycero-D-manno-heptose 1,7-bisphosphate phosphatase [Parcubacteria group bacterium Greene0714_36]|nr:MAG: D-glycero-D-manno-heptose 1,7-bisphosphate phosphatase [Parcubacteria group bacterium Greene0714_36]
MQHITQAVILAGGQGTRLRPITDTIPKPLVEINGRPFLAYLLDLLKKNGVSEVVLLLGYLPEKIMEYVGDGSRFGLSVQYSVGSVEDETGTRIKNAAHLLQDHFLLLYCDNYWPLDLHTAEMFYRGKGTLASVAVYANKDRAKKNNIRVEDGYVTAYDRTRTAPDLNGVEIGFFIMDKSITDMMPSGNFSFEDMIIPRLIADRELAGFMTDHAYYSIGSLERLPETEKFLRPRSVVFLDRDGVINKRPPQGEYIKNIGEFEFLPGACEALRLLKEGGAEVYIITNQAGIGRGYYCPHGWDAGCECRKPRAGMFFRASREHALDLTKAWWVGDDERDLEAGKVAGCHTILVTSEKNLLSIVRNEILR